MTEQDSSAAAEEVISVRGLCAGYNGEVVLEDVDLSVRALDFVGLVGPNRHS